MNRKQVKVLINRALKPLGISVLSIRELHELMQSQAFHNELESVPRERLVSLAPFFIKSKSQFGQDLFALAETDFKQGGYFVDFGAADGVNLSNSLLLEQEFGWKGICAEPAKCYHDALRVNRSANIETACVWKVTGAVLDFNEVSEPTLSTIASYNEGDFHSSARMTGTRYKVSTISLLDLLQKHNAPPVIDYLSIDTEGSEYEILQAFDFNQYRFKVITCEHNYTPAREKIFDLLSARGYVRRYPGLSRWDDWYILKS